MGIYDGIYLYSDIDGTLVDDNKAIPEINIKALKKFTEYGGKFGVATGRSPHNLSNYPELLPLNAPSILDNGGVLYDVCGKKFIECTYIPREKSLDAVYKMLELCPEASVQIYTRQAIYQANLKADRWVDPLSIKENIPEIPCKAEDVPGEWIKIVLCLPEEKLDKTIEQLNIDELSKHFGYTRSGKIYFELLKLGMNKGSGIEMLRKNDNSVKKVLAIGDFFNDVELLKQADETGAPVSGEESIKAMVDHITCSNNEGAVADFLRIALGMEI